MKILFVTEYFPHGKITGGVEARSYYLSKHLAKDHGIQVICSRQEGQPREHEVNGVKVHRVGKDHPYTHEGSFLSRLSFVDAAIDRGVELDFDLVDGQSFLAYLPAYGIGERKRAVKVATYHETWIGDWIENKGLITGIGGEIWERLSLGKDWDRILSVSEFTKNRLVERGVDGQKVDVVPNGVDLSEFEEVEVEKTEEPTVCTVSRLTEKKKVDLVMKAFEKVSEKFPSCKLRVVGDGPEYDKLERLADELDADIELVGYVPDKRDVIRIMKESHVFVSASVLEGFGVSVIESAASGTPYVVSDIEPHVEVTKGEKGGLVFRRDDREDLEGKISRLLENRELYEEKKKECRSLAKEYDWGKVVDGLERIYSDLL